MKKIITINFLVLLLGTSVFAANTEILTKAMVKLINKQKTLENAIIVLKQNQNKTNRSSSPIINNTSDKELMVLNSQIRDIKKELYFAKNINTMNAESNYKYKRDSKKIAEIDSFISSNN